MVLLVAPYTPWAEQREAPGSLGNTSTRPLPLRVMSNAQGIPIPRLYLDNAATSFPKPPGVLQAMCDYARRLGASAGRGAYSEAIETGDLLAQCRREINGLLNGESDRHVIFTLNCTDALNLALRGLIDPFDPGHVVCSAADHNSILRPIHAMAADWGLAFDAVPVDPGTTLIDPEAIRKAIRPETRYVAITHASNVTGVVQPVGEIGRICREMSIPFLVDAAQSAGHLPIDVQADNIDLLAAPGHKALMGPLGTGFLYIRPGIENGLRPLREGGTGSQSDEPVQPQSMPERYEPGSHNAIGLAGLMAGIRWVRGQGLDQIAAHEQSLVRTFIDAIAKIEGVRYFGPQGAADRIGVFSLRIDGFDPHELSAALETGYGVLTRSGIHCAPFIHDAIGTLQSGGATRLSFGPFVTTEDVRFAADALAQTAAATMMA